MLFYISIRPCSPPFQKHESLACVTAAILLLTCFLPNVNAAGPLPEQESTTYTTMDGVNLKVETVVSSLEVPWSLAFEGEDLYFTERRGKLWVVRAGSTKHTLIADLDEVYADGEGGLMGLAFHPEFKKNSFLYLSYSYKDGSRTMNRVVQFRLSHNVLERSRTIVDGLPGSGIHNGCRIRFGPDGKLYITTGDAARRETAQDLSSLGGKVLRVNDDGTIPTDNPFRNSPVFSLGHRNGQGLDWHPSLHLLFESEHGPSGFDGPGGGDEINLVEAGENYGWPRIHHKEAAEGMMSPLAEFTPAVAPSGASFCTGKSFPQFKNNFFVATLRGKRLLRVQLNPKSGREITGIENLFTGVFGRLRDLIEGPDGYLYFCTSNKDGRGVPQESDDRILRIVPITR
jgi:glucose/arabinose dehydrogenase